MHYDIYFFDANHNFINFRMNSVDKTYKYIAGLINSL